MSNTHKRIKIINKEITKLKTLIHWYSSYEKPLHRGELVKVFDYGMQSLDLFIEQLLPYKGKDCRVIFADAVMIEKPETDESYNERCLQYEENVKAKIDSLQLKLKEFEEELLYLDKPEHNEYL